MLTLHPRTIGEAIVFHGVGVIDLQKPTSSSAKLLNRLFNTYHADKGNYTLGPITVQEPCPLTEFEGQHVQHRTFAPDCGDASSTFYRFPRVVTSEEAAEWFEANDIQYTPVHCYHEYDCCGHWYTSGSYIHRDRKQTVVQISWYRNV